MPAVNRAPLPNSHTNDQPLWGATRADAGSWDFALWAPSSSKVSLCISGHDVPMRAEADGIFRATHPAEHGDTYAFRVDGSMIPDPASRQQHSSVSGLSLLHDPDRFKWQSRWEGRPWRDQVIYELHVGTFTPEGTFLAASHRLPELADLGITAIELMPIAHAPGNRGWGYDGVLPYAPHPAYGTPNQLRQFIDRAHGLGISVILDVVFNHFGPQDAHLLHVVPEFTSDHQTPWGRGFAFHNPAVRRYFIDCALMWLHEYRLDGLRLDAVHQMHDPSMQHILEDIGHAIRSAGFSRPIHLITEDERNDPTLHEAGLYDAQWNDDYHHAVHVLLTGESEGYYAPFAKDPLGDLARALTEGFVAQGQPRPGHPAAPGKPSAHLPPDFFVSSNQTHDQVGNRAFGDRLITLAPTEAVRVAHAMLLTSPHTPMLFMGEERGEVAPFQSFADYSGPIGRAVRAGRRAEMAAFAAFADEVPDPIDPETLHASRLGWSSDARAQEWLDLTRHLLRFRAERLLPLFRSGLTKRPRAQRTGPRNLAVRWPFAKGDVAVWINLGTPPDTPPPVSNLDLSMNELTADPFAFGLKVAS